MTLTLSVKKLKISFILFFWLLICVSGCHRPHTDTRLHIVATTTHLESVLKSIGDSDITVSVLIPPGTCPGHYDIRPGDVRLLSRSAALFVHGYEGCVPRLIASVGHPAPRLCRVNVLGNWLIPTVHQKAVAEAARLLSDIDPSRRSIYERRRDECLRHEASVSAHIRKLCAPIRGTPVICSNQQSQLLQWMGLEVVGEYGRTDELTPNLIHNLAKVGRERKVRLIVDNLQSAPDAGKQLAQEIGASRVTLSNFPGGYPGTNTWEKCLHDNVSRVLAALKKETKQ